MLATQIPLKLRLKNKKGSKQEVLPRSKPLILWWSFTEIIQPSCCCIHTFTREEMISSELQVKQGTLTEQVQETVFCQNSFWTLGAFLFTLLFALALFLIFLIFFIFSSSMSHMSSLSLRIHHVLTCGCWRGLSTMGKPSPPGSILHVSSYVNALKPSPASWCTFCAVNQILNPLECGPNLNQLLNWVSNQGNMQVCRMPFKINKCHFLLLSIMM